MIYLVHKWKREKKSWGNMAKQNIFGSFISSYAGMGQEHLDIYTWMLCYLWFIKCSKTGSSIKPTKVIALGSVLAGTPTIHLHWSSPHPIPGFEKKENRKETSRLTKERCSFLNPGNWRSSDDSSLWSSKGLWHLGQFWSAQIMAGSRCSLWNLIYSLISPDPTNPNFRYNIMPAPSNYSITWGVAN